MSLLINGLKFPLKLLAKLVKRKPKRTELEQKCHQHVRNFAPTHHSWQQRPGKKLTKKQREWHKNRRKKE